MTQAIFLSYASQDADAARRLCNALRAAGLEVWFDQSELRGGDAWDASIRKQIKECAIFIPVISTNTNAREEGYFRLEWKLAVDRTHLMADTKAFLLPVLLEGTIEATALVPDKFRERQWTRIDDDTSVTKFTVRVKNVLVPQKNEGAKGGAGMHSSTTAPTGNAPTSRRRVIISAAAFTTLAAGVAGVTVWRPWTGDAAGSNSGRPRDPQLERAAKLLQGYEIISTDISLAEEIVKSVLTTKPADVDATVMMARVQGYTLSRGFDRSEERFALAKKFCERALAVAPQDPEAIVAMAIYLNIRRIDPPRAVALLKAAIALRPEEPRYYTTLSGAMTQVANIPLADVIAFAKSSMERFPDNPLVAYDLAGLYRAANMFAEMEYYLDRAIALGPLDSALSARARYALYLHGDLALMKQLLDKMPVRSRETDRAILGQFSYALMSNTPEVGLAALAGTPEPWLADSYEYTGPTQFLVGELLLLQGKTELAKSRFDAALVELERRKAAMPNNIALLFLSSWLFLRLGRLAEAKARNALAYAELPRPYRLNTFGTPSFGPIPLNLLLGERTKALALIKEAVETPLSRAMLSTMFRFDPRLARFRVDQEIVALVSEAAKTK